LKSKYLVAGWAFVACLLAAHNAWLWLGQKITPDTDILALLPVQQRDPVLGASFTHMVDAAQQRVVVLVGAPEWDSAVRAADAYAAVLSPRRDLLALDKTDDASQADWLAPFQRHAMTLLTTEQERKLAASASAPGQWRDAALSRLYGAFSGPKLGAVRDDPFGLFAGWVQERAGETPVRPRDNQLFVAGEGRQYVLLSLRLQQPAFSRTAQARVLPLLERARAAALAVSPSVEVLNAGVVLHAGAAGQQAEHEMSTIGLGSLIGIVLLTWLTFRSALPVGLILLSIAVGLLGALSVCWLLFGRIHLLTLVFGASLIGVAQDYGVYFLCQRLAADPALGSHALLRRLLPALGLTLLAAVIGYMGLALTPFPGLRHMAVFSATGLVFAWLTVVCWFPSLIKGGSLRGGALARRYSALLQHWPRWSARPASLALAGGLALAAALGWSKLTVNDDIRSLQTPPAALVREQLKLGKLLDAPTPVQYYLVRAATQEELLRREENLKTRLDSLVAAHALSGYQAMSNWVPSAAAQQRRRALVEAHLLAPGGPLTEVARAIGEDDAWAASSAAHLRGAGAMMTVEEFLRSRASEPWRHLWLGEAGGVHASIVALRGVQYAALPLLATAGKGVDGVQWVDKVGEISAVLGSYRAFMAWVVMGAFATVFAVLALRYRARAWRVLAPTVLASGVTLAVLGFLGQPLTLFHVLALMLLLGVGVDYGIFMQERAEGVLAAPWLAVGLSAVNTILSFGLLALSNTPALQAFGTTMLVGTALAWLCAPCFTLSPMIEEKVDEAALV
jgi:predicted exporter